MVEVREEKRRRREGRKVMKRVFELEALKTS